MENQKENNFSFEHNAKASIQDRLRYLFKGRSMRQASIDWGLPYSTLNNYFAKGATPGLDVVIRISAYEGVSIGWLATGMSDWGTGKTTDALDMLYGDESTNPSYSNKERFDEEPSGHHYKQEDALLLTWGAIFDALNANDKAKLINIFVTFGAQGIIRIFNNFNEVDSEWTELTTEEKERLIRLNEQLKKGSLEASEDVAKPGPSSSSKKAS
ncbi:MULTISPECIES: helix-turn-helix domain-containing protein [Klebsiella/Raoultella group]|uniref:helix-turn-helix domain-containing protein n=1 Tax=Klebsiella/Raoultella group TaxID=2890311 RepID=UPI00069EED99|nr:MULTISPECIES: helix-turn-helix domain-containing protein [Klebsiella]EGT0065539.1 transcriptional regulator [Klebsiella michiganensis]MBZ7337519.1 transcriptional regulator [Klebsiella grimontii]WDI68221.1 transcriptional regulator [Klebsiella grimontii]HCB1317305.1 transcriptional regulator [Klebsiella variicola subsp. variicola]